MFFKKDKQLLAEKTELTFAGPPDDIWEAKKVFNPGRLYLPDEELVLEETIKHSEKETIRTDYAMVPKHAMLELDDGRVCIDTNYVRRFDDLIHFVSSEYSNLLDKGNDSLKTFLTSDGKFIYVYGGVPLLEICSEVCLECRECHEQIPTYSGLSRSVSWFTNLRDLRKYHLRGILTFLAWAEVAIVQVDHPCKVRSLQETLFPSITRVVDPPIVKLVYPSDFKPKKLEWRK